MIFNFVCSNEDFKPTHSEIIAMFAAFKEEEIDPLDNLFVDDFSSLEELAVQAGIFKSKGECRRNGLSGPIPHGISWIGTKKKRFWVWNPIENQVPTFKKNFDRTAQWLKKPLVFK